MDAMGLISALFLPFAAQADTGVVQGSELWARSQPWQAMDGGKWAQVGK